jgi:hypothetical protein
MSAEENKAAVRHFWQDHLNTGNATLCENDFAPDAVNHDPNSPAVPPGPEGMGQLITLYRTAFPDLTATVEDVNKSRNQAKVLSAAQNERIRNCFFIGQDRSPGRDRQC